MVWLGHKLDVQRAKVSAAEERVRSVHAKTEEKAKAEGAKKANKEFRRSYGLSTAPPALVAVATACLKAGDESSATPMAMTSAIAAIKKQPKNKWKNVWHCAALHCTALHCTALHCTALHFAVCRLCVVCCGNRSAQKIL